MSVSILSLPSQWTASTDRVSNYLDELAAAIALLQHQVRNLEARL